MFSKRLKKISLILTAITLIALAPATKAQESIFTDISTGDQHYIAISYLKEIGLIEGYPDGSFQPLREINRAEALKILMLAFPNNDLILTESDATAEVQSLEVPFEDVHVNEWYYNYIASAYDANIVKGYPDGLFHPEQTINKAEALKIAILQEGWPLPVEITEPPYPDVPVDIWFAPYAFVSSERTLFNGNRENGGLDPAQNINRGNFAEMIYRMMMSANGSLFARTTWYGNEFANWGTASGEAFDPNALTAAHKTLPFGTEIEVTNMANGESVIVKINDRGPYATGMDLDLSRAAFEEIASLGTGIIFVEFKEKGNMIEYAF